MLGFQTGKYLRGNLVQSKTTKSFSPVIENNVHWLKFAWNSTAPEHAPEVILES